MRKQAKDYGRKALYILPLVIIAIGILLRVAVYLQNRCLILDEVNVALNVYERGFAGLALPLDHQQYAPPVFLWALKALALVMGYSEYALRLFPLLCGIASLLLLYRVLKSYTDETALWYPLLMVGTGLIYIRYAAEVKQYASDVAIVLSLILLSLRFDILKMRPVKFLLLWFVSGSISIWASMPSVFMLASVGLYYLFILIREKNHSKIPLLIGIGALWGCQFLFYYYALLKPQINSGYLQGWHQGYFLIALPKSLDDLKANWDVFSNVLGVGAGHWALSVVLHMLTLVVGTVYLVRNHTAKAILIIMPVAFTLIAAAMHQFTLVPRVVLYMMVLLMILMGKGLEVLLRIRFLPLQLALVAIAIICFVNFNRLDLMYNRMDEENITAALDFVQQQQVQGPDLYLHELAYPVYTYYTTIHPAKLKRQELLGANKLTWETNYERLGESLRQKTALLYIWIENQAAHDEQQAAVAKYNSLDKSYHEQNAHVYIYLPNRR